MLLVTSFYHLRSSSWPLETHSWSRIFLLSLQRTHCTSKTDKRRPPFSGPALKKKYYTIHKTCALLTKTVMGILFLQPCLSVLVSFQYRTSVRKPGPSNNRARINLKPAMEGNFLYSCSDDLRQSYCEGQKYLAAFVLWCGLIIYTVELTKITR